MKRMLQLVLGLAIAAVLLWRVFRGVDGTALLAALTEVHLGWLLLAEVPMLFSFVTRIWRWRYIVRSSRPDTGFRPMFSATQIGFLANYSLPLRVGELIRAAALARLARIPVSESLAMVTLDRVADVLALIVMLLLTVLVFPPTQVRLPPGTFGNTEDLTISSLAIRAATIGVTLFLLAVVALLVLLYLRRDLVLRLVRATCGRLSVRLAERLCGLLESFAAGLQVFGSRGDMFMSLAFNLLTWLLFVAYHYCILTAFGLQDPWYVTLVVLSAIGVFQSAPGAPGFVGQYHFAVVAGLMLCLPSLDPVTAKATAIVCHAGVVLPVSLVGVACLLWEQVGLLELKREAEQADEPPS